MAGQARDHVGPAEEDAGLGSAEELVAARGHQVGAGGQGAGGVGLVGQQRVGREQAAAQVGDQRHIMGVGQRPQLVETAPPR